MKATEGLLKAFLEQKKYAWSALTFKNERWRLYKLLPFLFIEPKNLWEKLDEFYVPYTKTIAWTRVAEFYDFYLDIEKKNERNIYKDWRRANKRVFKNVYEKKLPTISFEEAKRKILTIPILKYRDHALAMIMSAIRWCESVQESAKKGKVIGKGNKLRSVFIPKEYELSTDITARSFRKCLKEYTGLEIHDLRKLAITRLVQSGLNEYEVMQIAGWEDINTAKFYVAPRNDKELEKIMRKSLK